MLFCAKRCEVAFKKAKPETHGPDLATYRRLVFGTGIGRGPKGIMSTNAEGQVKPIAEWPEEPGHFQDAFNRVLDLNRCLGEKAKNKRRPPIVLERLARLRRLARQG